MYHTCRDRLYHAAIVLPVCLCLYYIFIPNINVATTSPTTSTIASANTTKGECIVTHMYMFNMSEIVYDKLTTHVFPLSQT